MLKKYAIALMLLVAPTFFMAESAMADTYTAGKDYRVLEDPIRTNSNTIVVNEFFGYLCPHCNSFHPVLKNWEKKLPEEVSFVPVPVSFNRQWEIYARAYYIAVQLGVYDTVHDAIFNAVHVDRRNLGTKSALRKFFASFGVDEAKFDQAYSSFGIKNNMRKGNRLAAKAKITGVPSLMVAGKYIINSTMAGSQEAMLKIADFLIEKEKSLAN